MMRLIWTIVITGSLLLGAGNGRPQQAAAQGPPPPALQPVATVTPDRPDQQEAERTALYEELASEVALIERLGNLVKRVSRLVRPSVVHIEASKTEQQRGRTEAFDEAGAGVIIRIDDQLWVLTNRHVVLGAAPDEILLTLSDGRELHPKKTVDDASTDVAILLLDRSDVSPARLGDSSKVDIGDFVLAVGSPFGLSHSVTFGIISAKGRRALTLGEEKIELQDFFQTDAAINPGNSGGPLLNLRGEVIGLNTAIASSSGGSEGIGFAIPVNMAMRVAEQLARNGRMQRAYLGVTLEQNFSAADAARLGVPAPGGALIKIVSPGSPAERANLQKGDVILEFGGVRIDDDDHLVAQAGLTPVGTDVGLLIVRNGRSYRTTVTMAPLPTAAP